MSAAVRMGEKSTPRRSEQRQALPEQANSAEGALRFTVMDTSDREAHPPSEESPSSPPPESTEWLWPAYPSDVQARAAEPETPEPAEEAPEDAAPEDEPIDEPIDDPGGTPTVGAEEDSEPQQPASEPEPVEVEAEEAVPEPVEEEPPAEQPEPRAEGEPAEEEHAAEAGVGEPEPARPALVVRLEPPASEEAEDAEPAAAEPSAEPEVAEATEVVEEAEPPEEAPAPAPPEWPELSEWTQAAAPVWTEPFDWRRPQAPEPRAPEPEAPEPEAPARDEPPAGDPAAALAVPPDDVTLPIPVVTPIPPPPVKPRWPPPPPAPTWGAPREWGPPGRPAGRRRRGLIIAIALLLTAALMAVSLVELAPTLRDGRDSTPAASGSTGGALSSPAQRDRAAAGQADPAAAVRPILASRAAAVLHHDRAAFLATVDRRRTTFYRAQAALFDRIVTVPFSYLVYRVSGPGQDLASARVRSRYAPSPVYLPEVEASYRFRGQDSAPVTSRYFYTFVETSAGWRIAGQGEAAAPRKDDVEIWDASPVRSLASSRTLVVYHAADRALAERLLSAAERGYSQVAATWSAPWDHKVVILVPHDQVEAERLVHGRDLSAVAAVASSQIEDGPEHRVLGNRVIVNASVIRRYNALNLQIVVTHEMTHVATRKVGVGVPLFLVEGFADFTALRPIDAPPRITRPALRAAVRTGRFKGTLPSGDDLRGSDATLAYDEGSSFCLWIARTFGEAKVQSLYRSFSGGREPTPELLDRRLRQVLGISRATAQSRWAAWVRQAL